MNLFLPERLLSRLVGHLTRINFPAFILRPALKLYIRHFNVDLSEAKRPLEEYKNFTDFFTRVLVEGARPIDPSDKSMVSPVDGKVYVAGKLDAGRLLHAKGKYYSLAELLGSEKDAALFEGGSFATIYLSPRDYHRIHSPVSGEIQRFRYLPGKLLPVNPPSVALFPKLFAQNERLVSFIETQEWGVVALVKVGATNVGRIKLSYMDYVTNRWGKASVEEKVLPQKIHVEKGEEIAMFEMGSTVILVTQKGIVFQDLTPEKELRLGAKIAQSE